MNTHVNSYVFRAPTWNDLAAVTRVVQRVNVAEVGEPDYWESDLRAEWGERRFVLARNAILTIAPDGEVVGYAWFYDRQEHIEFVGDVHVVPEHASPELVGELLLRIEAAVVACSQPAPPETRVTFCVPAYQHVAHKHALLKAANYEVIRYYTRMEIMLDAAPEVPPLPNGVTMRPCVRDRDESACHEVLQDAFRTHFRHVAQPEADWIQRHAGSNEFYRPELWYVAEEDGRAIGAVVNFYFDDLGWVDELGVRESERGRGLGRALLLRTFAGFYAAGQPRVALGVDAGNDTGATQLYDSVGMRQAHRLDLYEKVIRELPASSRG
jgi:GNAT superfamily N-acetyltransferase